MSPIQQAQQIMNASVEKSLIQYGFITLDPRFIALSRVRIKIPLTDVPKLEKKRVTFADQEEPSAKKIKLAANHFSEVYRISN